MSICILCSENKALIKKSHIIPEFMYRELFDEKHSIKGYYFNKDTLDAKHIKSQYTGEYEGGLFCENCDNVIIGKYEAYARKIIYGGSFSKSESQKMILKQEDLFRDTFICEGVDYTKFKLFLLSILWRSSISSREFFSDIDIGEEACSLKEMIYIGNAGEWYEYPILILSYHSDKTIPTDLILQPRQIKHENGLLTCTFFISGLICIYFVTRLEDKLKPLVIKNTIRPDNTMKIVNLPIGYASSYINKFVGFNVI